MAPLRWERQALLAAGAEIDARDKDGETDLFSAAFLDRVAAAPEIVEHGADVNALSQQRITPLMEATSHTPQVVDLPIRGGAHVDAPDGLGETTLMMAAGGGRSDIVRALIKTGADVNAKDQ